MAQSKNLVQLVVLVAVIPQAYPVAVGTVIAVAGIVKDVVEFGFKLQQQTTDEGTDGISSEEIIEKLQQMIENSDTKTIGTIGVNSKIEKLDTAVASIHSAMTILKRIFNTSNPILKVEHVGLFYTIYPRVVKDIHFLPQLLTYSVPGFDYKLLHQLMKMNRCNLSVLQEFARFYLDLLEDGFVIEVMYYRFKQMDIPKTVSHDWKKWLQTVQEIFTDTEADCARQFTNLTNEDFLQATDALTLGRENTERYIYNWSDVTFYAPVGTYQFQYHFKTENIQVFFQKTDDQNKLAVYGSRTEKMTFEKTTVRTLLQNANFDFPNRGDQSAAMNLCEAVKRKLEEHEYFIAAISVFFSGSSFSLKSNFIDPDSTLITFTLHGVVLEYCYELGVVCTVKRWLQIGKTTSGSFNVHVYLSEEDTRGQSFVHGGAGKHSDVRFLLVILLSVLAFTLSKVLISHGSVG